MRQACQAGTPSRSLVMLLKVLPNAGLRWFLASISLIIQHQLHYKGDLQVHNVAADTAECPPPVILRASCALLPHTIKAICVFRALLIDDREFKRTKLWSW